MVERFSNHYFLAWEIDIPARKEKSDINHLADDFRIIFRLNFMTHLQDPKCIPKVLWLTIANPDPVQGTINISWVQAEPYDASVDGAKLGHTYRVLIHVDKVEDYSFVPHASQLHYRSFEWCLGVLEGEDVCATPLDGHACNQRPQRHRDHEDEDEGGDRDYYQP
ncbi:hypothetical protein GUJ93_ZPchr0002g26704 [Zizania palustris]|uniref:Uncharacterized protein n=1 Tax=Zizania palustris TaxID=103762 RepID=A0A8J5SJ43_ZIZPA|nr:hypothetical protein GUJ93_ZPchr0002g26704 [Zizania palustris]